MKFTEQEWANISKWLDVALDLPPSDRENWIDSLPDLDNPLKSTLRELVAADVSGQLNSLFDDRRHVASVMESGHNKRFEPTSTGRLLGRYRLIRELGRGGMGEVWLAERVDGVLKRNVAIKLPHVGVYGGQFVARLLRERDILAGLTHPNIARLYDADVSTEGNPFIALEYIEGTEVISYCDSRSMSVGERIQLFAQILNAVQYAHSHLVVHRDLKPSNILVTGDGQVKLLDFGVAKLLAEDSVDETELTRSAGRPLTLTYASPEQVAGEFVSTASDIYTLGVLFYELLTGERPYRLKSYSRADLQAAILTGDIVRPSHIITSDKASVRGTSSIKLESTLRGDLESIILNALKRHPQERYGSADAFAQDIRRYQQGYAVLAQGESNWYRTRKFLLRNRIPATAALVMFLALGVGVTMTLWQANEARKLAAIARIEAETANSVQEFLQGLFEANTANQPDPLKKRLTTARELLDIGAARIDNALNKTPIAKLRILTTLSEMYGELDLPDKVLELDRKRVELARTIYGPTSVILADLLLDLANDAHNQDLLALATQPIAEATEILDRVGDDSSSSRTKLEGALADHYRNIDFRKALKHAEREVRLMDSWPASSVYLDNMQSAAEIQLEGGHYSAGEVETSKALAAARVLGSNAFSSLSWLEERLAESLEGSGDFTNAEQHYRNSIEFAQKYHGRETVSGFFADTSLVGFLGHTSRFAEALAIASPACEMADRLYRRGITTSLLPEGLLKCARIFIEYGLPEHGFRVLEEAERMRGNLEPLPTIVMRILDERSSALIEVGQYGEAESLLDHSAQIQQQIGREDTPWHNRNVMLRSELSSLTGHCDEALKILNIYRHLSPLDDGSSELQGETSVLRAEISLRRNDLTTARDLAQQARSRLATSANGRFLISLEARLAIVEGKADLLSGNPRDALPLLQRSVIIRKQTLAYSSPKLAESEIALGECYRQLRDRRTAVALLNSARDRCGRHPHLGTHFLQPLSELERRLGRSS